MTALDFEAAKVASGMYIVYIQILLYTSTNSCVITVIALTVRLSFTGSPTPCPMFCAGSPL